MEERSAYRRPRPQTGTGRPPGTSASSPQPEHSDRECAICISDSHHAVRTNCGHLFCAACMITYWQSRQWDGPMTCPLCRRQVIVLLTEFSSDEQRRPQAERQPLINVINQYNARFADQSQSWFQSVRDMPTLLRRCLSEIFSASGLALLFRLRVLMLIVAAIVYIVLPVDLIPEMIFGIFGLIDDFLIAILIAVRICLEYRQQIAGLAAAAAAAPMGSL